MKELLTIIAAREASPDLPFALATVVGVVGSSYRRPGARMLIGAAGRITGSVSGGCLEEDVIAHGLEVIMSGTRQLLRYDTANEEDRVFGTGLGCRGQIEILVEALPAKAPWPLADTVTDVLSTRQPAVVSTVVSGEILGATPLDLAVQPGPFPRRQVVMGTSGAVDLFVEQIRPANSLVIFGGGPDATPLVRLAREVGFRVTVIDRRRAVVDNFREADEAICRRLPSLAGTLVFGSDCAVVIMNHHYETDRDCLEFVLPLLPGYVGMLGPRSRTDRILDDLAKRGTSFAANELAGLNAPAGLDLGSETPEQIALSILAEVQACLNGRNARKLRYRSAPINSPQG